MRKPNALPPLSECTSCHEPIRFVRMLDTGTAMPVNPKPGSRGNVAAHRIRGPLGVSLEGYVLSTHRHAHAAYPLRFTPHAATCETTRPATVPAPAPAPTLF